MDIETLNLSPRTRRAIDLYKKQTGIKTAEDLMAYGEEGLLRWRYIGCKTVAEIREALERKGLYLPVHGTGKQYVLPLSFRQTP